ncbi:MAG: hypothetical protein ACOX81_06995 [Candidatus Heteroscillospira sp.]|jgi:hypothetical protein
MQKMNRYAFKVTATVCVLSAFGFAARWAQNMSIFDPETHLAAPWAASSIFLVLFSLASAIGLGILLLPVLSYGLGEEPAAAVRGSGELYKGLCAAIGAAVCLAGAVLMLQAGNELYPMLRKVLGALAILSGAGIISTGWSGKHDAGSSSACFWSIVPVLFCCFWLIVSYKDHSANPVIWSYAVEIIAISAAAVALYLIAGFLFFRARLFPTCLMCAIGTFLCFMVLGDERAVSCQVFFAGLGLFLLITLHALLSGLDPTLRRHFHLKGE